MRAGVEIGETSSNSTYMVYGLVYHYYALKQEVEAELAMVT